MPRHVHRHSGVAVLGIGRDGRNQKASAHECCRDRQQKRFPHDDLLKFHRVVARPPGQRSGCKITPMRWAERRDLRVVALSQAGFNRRGFLGRILDPQRRSSGWIGGRQRQFSQVATNDGQRRVLARIGRRRQVNKLQLRAEGRLQDRRIVSALAAAVAYGPGRWSAVMVVAARRLRLRNVHESGILSRRRCRGNNRQQRHSHPL